MKSSAKDVGARLNQLIATKNLVPDRDRDPVSFVHRYSDPADREVVGLIAALLAFGNVTAIRAKVGQVLDILGTSPARAIDTHDRIALETMLDGFAHRVWKGGDVAALLANAGELRRREGTLGKALERELIEADRHHADPDLAFLEALARWSDRLRGDRPSRGLSHLVPDPRRGSACKRLMLYVRWMSRPYDGIDVGGWAIPTRRLIIPVDTHIQRIGRNLRLTQRTDASLRTALEITRSLRLHDPEDPVRYDFALCHLGVSRECPSRRDPSRCQECVLREVCRHWSPKRARTR